MIDEDAYDGTVKVKIEHTSISDSKYISCIENEECAGTLPVNSVTLKNEEAEGCYIEKRINGDCYDLEHKNDNSFESASTKSPTNTEEMETSVCSDENKYDCEMPKIFQCQRCKLNIGNEDFFRKHILHCGR